MKDSQISVSIWLVTEKNPLIRRKPIMETGIVKWFNSDKGYGFIEYNDAEDIFVHFTGIEAEGYKSLTEGQKVMNMIDILGIRIFFYNTLHYTF